MPQARFATPVAVQDQDYTVRHRAGHGSRSHGPVAMTIRELVLPAVLAQPRADDPGLPGRG